MVMIADLRSFFTRYVLLRNRETYLFVEVPLVVVFSRLLFDFENSIRLLGLIFCFSYFRLVVDLSYEQCQVVYESYQSEKIELHQTHRPYQTDRLKLHFIAISQISPDSQLLR
jgi:hypothetical protein